VREILGRYLGISAQIFVLAYEANGKTAVVEDQNPQQLRFNYFHSSGLAVIAVASGGRSEVVSRKSGQTWKYLELAERFFPQTSNPSHYQQMPSNQLARAFFACGRARKRLSKPVAMGCRFPCRSFPFQLIRTRRRHCRK